MYGQRSYSCYISPSLALNGEGFGYPSLLTSHCAKRRCQPYYDVMQSESCGVSTCNHTRKVKLITADHAYELQCSTPRLTGVPALNSELQPQVKQCLQRISETEHTLGDRHIVHGGKKHCQAQQWMANGIPTV